MRQVQRIANARLRGREGLFDLVIDGAVIADVSAATMDIALESDSTQGKEIDAAGGLVCPSFVDPHLHLDLAYSLEMVPENRSGTLVEAIGLWSEAKRTITAENVRERAVRAIKQEVSYGTGFIRTHVDVATNAGLRLVEGVLAAREQMKHLCEIEVVVFPQDGILRDPGAREQMAAAMRMGCDVIGGIAHNERTASDSRRHCEILFELAKEFDAPIDCHIDETDAPESRCVEELAALALANPAWAGRVTGSHVCALASYTDVHAAKVVSMIVDAGMHVVCNPCVNMHLQGRFDRYPKRRGLTRVSELLARGVTVGAGQDCIKDPFYPLGTGQMLDIAHMLVHADHLSRPEDIEYAFDCVGANAARIMGIAGYGVSAGCGANLVVLPVESAAEAVRMRARPVAVVREGREVASSKGQMADRK
jgi:cytosine deaminase